MADYVTTPEWVERGCRTLCDVMADFFKGRVATDGIRANELSQLLRTRSRVRHKPKKLDKKRA